MATVSPVIRRESRSLVRTYSCRAVQHGDDCGWCPRLSPCLAQRKRLSRWSDRFPTLLLHVSVKVPPRRRGPYYYHLITQGRVGTLKDASNLKRGVVEDRQKSNAIYNVLAIPRAQPIRVGYSNCWRHQSSVVYLWLSTRTISVWKICLLSSVKTLIKW